MLFDAQAAIDQLSALLAEIEPRLEGEGGNTWFAAPEAERNEMKTRAVAAIERLAPAWSRYVGDATADRVEEQPAGMAVVVLAGILRALRADYAAGYLRNVEDLVRADVFADFLEMADELLKNNYKDAAAVITGGVLEAHLRKLADRHGMATVRSDRPVTAATLNDELPKNDPSYSRLTQKSVTASLDLRNSAAHGRYDEYDGSQVEDMIRQVRGFVERNPA